MANRKSKKSMSKSGRSVSKSGGSSKAKATGAWTAHADKVKSAVGALLVLMGVAEDEAVTKEDRHRLRTP